MLTLVIIYIVDTHIYSLQLVIIVIVFKRLAKIKELLKAFVLIQFNYRFKSSIRLLKHRCTNRVAHTHVKREGDRLNIDIVECNPSPYILLK